MLHEQRKLVDETIGVQREKSTLAVRSHFLERVGRTHDAWQAKHRRFEPLNFAFRAGERSPAQYGQVDVDLDLIRISSFSVLLVNGTNLKRAIACRRCRRGVPCDHDVKFLAEAAINLQ